MTQLEELNQKLLTCQQLTARYPNRYQLEAAIARGRYRRVTRGFYLHRSDWDKLTPEETYLARVLALAASYPGIIFSHQTAALLHGLPLESLPFTSTAITAPVPKTTPYTTGSYTYPPTPQCWLPAFA